MRDAGTHRKLPQPFGDLHGLPTLAFAANLPTIPLDVLPSSRQIKDRFSNVGRSPPTSIEENMIQDTGYVILPLDSS